MLNFSFAQSFHNGHTEEGLALCLYHARVATALFLQVPLWWYAAVTLGTTSRNLFLALVIFENSSIESTIAETIRKLSSVRRWSICLARTALLSSVLLKQQACKKPRAWSFRPVALHCLSRWVAHRGELARQHPPSLSMQLNCLSATAVDVPAYLAWPVPRLAIFFQYLSRSLFFSGTLPSTQVLSWSHQVLQARCTHCGNGHRFINFWFDLFLLHYMSALACCTALISLPLIYISIDGLLLLLLSNRICAITKKMSDLLGLIAHALEHVPEMKSI